MRNPNAKHPADETAHRVLALYAQGQFPMADMTETDPGQPAPIYVFDPEERAVIPLDDGALRIPRSLRQRVRSHRFRITCDQAFSEVIRACARTGSPIEGCWIDGQIIDIYENLHAMGHAHSIEAWIDRDGTPTLVGGLYGVHLRSLFAGESMFSAPELGGTDASKVCMVHLWTHLRAQGFALLDAQYPTPHLESLGAIEITRDDYRQRLEHAIAQHADWGVFDPRRARTSV